MPSEYSATSDFDSAAAGWIRGDFSALAPLFESNGDDPAPVLRWFEEGRFQSRRDVLGEAFANACFIGKVDVVRYLLDHGVDPNAGGCTGLNGFHWAINRGQLAVVGLLIDRGASLELKNSHGTTALGTAVWSAKNEPKPDHLAILDALIAAGADKAAVTYRSGETRIDSRLE